MSFLRAVDVGLVTENHMHGQRPTASRPPGLRASGPPAVPLSSLLCCRGRLPERTPGPHAMWFLPACDQHAKLSQARGAEESVDLFEQILLNVSIF